MAPGPRAAPRSGLGALLLAVEPRLVRDQSLRRLVVALQGQWGDDVGLSVHVRGHEAVFSDAPDEKFLLLERDGRLLLRDAHFRGIPSVPTWKYLNGAKRRWARRLPQGSDDHEWANLFQSFKDERAMIREKLANAMALHSFKDISCLQSAWEGDGGIPESAPEDVRMRLSRGKRLIPGACVVHMKQGYRAAVLACEPWCAATAAWRARNRTAALPEGEAQPFYLCLVDERDQPRGRFTLAAEESLQPSDAAFPMEGYVVDKLLRRCDVLGGYLPRDGLPEKLLRLQKWAWSFGT